MNFIRLKSLALQALLILLVSCLYTGAGHAMIRLALQSAYFERTWIDQHFESCSIESAKKYIDNGNCINLQSPAGTTFLMQAIIHHQIETVDFILDNEPDVNLANKIGGTALHYAAQAGLEEVAQRLLQMGANPNAKSWMGWTPLMSAETYEQINVLRQLLMHPQVDVNAQDCSGYTALMYAALSNKCEIAAILLNHPSIDIHIVDDLACMVDLSILTPEMRGEFRFHTLSPFLKFLQSSQIQTPTTSMMPAQVERIPHVIKALENRDLTRFLCEFIG